jgi:hypothetical protein
MRLYSYQSIEVIATLHRDSVYYADINKCKWLNDPTDPEITRSNLRLAWEWLMAQYNKRKKHDYSSAPVWWYTSLKELQGNMKYAKSGEVLITADVPDSVILLYDADLWEEGPFSTCGLGWRGHLIHTSIDWKDNEKRFDAMLTIIWDAYKRSPWTMIETWSEIFNIRRSDGTQRIHAITPYIDVKWMIPTPINSTTSLSMEM